MNAKRARAMISIGADSRQLDRDLHGVRKKLRSFGKDAGKAIGGAGKKFGGALRGLMKSVGGGVGVGFGASLASGVGGAIMDVAGEVVAFEKDLVRLQIAAGKSEAEIAAFRSEVNRVSGETGVAREQVLASAGAYVALTSDVDGAEKAMSSFARIAQASGAKIEDVATAAGTLKNSGLVQNANEIEAAFSALIMTADRGGSVELPDFAATLNELAPQFSKFAGGQSLDGLREMAAAYQVIARESKNAEGGATKFKALMESLADPRTVRELKKVGIEVFGKNGKKRGATEIFEEIAKNRRLGDDRAMAQVFGRSEARDAASAIRTNIGLFHELFDAASDAGAVQRNLATYQESSVAKIEKAMNAAKLSLAEAFTPERIKVFAEALAMAADLFAKLVGYAEKLKVLIPDSASTDIQQGIAARELAAVGHLSGEARRKALEQRALALAANPSSTGMGIGKLDFGQFGEGREGALAAARELAKEAGTTLPQDDPWRSGSGGWGTDSGSGASRLDFAALKSAIVDAIRQSPFTLKMDSSAAAKDIANAPAHRAGRLR